MEEWGEWGRRKRKWFGNGGMNEEEVEWEWEEERGVGLRDGVG